MPRHRGEKLSENLAGTNPRSSFPPRHIDAGKRRFDTSPRLG